MTSLIMRQEYEPLRNIFSKLKFFTKPIHPKKKERKNVCEYIFFSNLDYFVYGKVHFI